MLENYIDEYVVQEIEKKFEIHRCFNDSDYLKGVLLEVQDYLEGMQGHNITALQKKRKAKINRDESYSFFRSKERIEYSQRLIQYLFFFLKEIPLQDKIKEEVINPFDQLKSFIYYMVNLLKEADVKKAIYKEYQKVIRLNEKNEWYYRGRISRVHETLRKNVEQLDNISIKNYLSAFEIILNLTLFWFSVRNQQLNQIRRSDKYMYILARLLIEKINKKKLLKNR